MEIAHFLRPFVPNVLVGLWLLLALFILWATKTNRRARWVGGVLLVCIWLLATRPVAETILWPLENRYAAPEVSSLRRQRVSQVVVLLGGSFPQQGEILSVAIGGSSLHRFLGGLELCVRLGETCRLVFSGSASLRHPDWSDAVTMQRLTQILSPEHQAVAEVRSQRTADHPRNVRPLVGNERFALVTSASHMPRAVRTFRRAGLHPIPYPVDFQASGDYGWDDWLPNADNLVSVEGALKEYLGLAFYAVRGW
jgi:uncharacterized SAM-binding protein YcdF (DUF218 family)